MEQFIQLGGVATNAATPSEVYEKNIAPNLARGLGRLHELPQFKVIKPNAEIAIVGGGPSVKQFVSNIAKYKYVFVAGSAHDWLISQGVIPTFAAVCDPDPIMANYLRSAHPEVHYLVSTHSPDEVFKALEGKSITLWHCLPLRKELLDTLDPGWQGIGGGCTIGLRSINIAIMLGFKNIHLYGFDSCVSIEGHHAYEFSTPEEEMGVLHNVRAAMDGEIDETQTFKCAGYQLAQASHFQDFMRFYGDCVNLKVFGEGLIQTLYRQIETKVQQLNAAKAESESSHV